MIKHLVNIQSELKAPKSNFNSFGKYRYRSAEDILTAVKPILSKYGCQMTITDDIVFIGNRFYIKATVTITDADGNSESVSAFAREDESKRGMDGSQITGTASSKPNKLTKAFLKEHGNDRIGSDEIYKLKQACVNAGENMSLEKALMACKKNSIEEVTFYQYTALMSQLGAVA